MELWVCDVTVFEIIRYTDNFYAGYAHNNGYRKVTLDNLCKYFVENVVLIL